MTTTPYMPRYVPQFRRTEKDLEEYIQLQFVSKNKEITERLAIKYLFGNSQRYQKLETIPEN